MSEPKRYHLEMQKANDGDWVLYADFARLKSLCDNLGMGGKHTITEIEAENARLKAEVERLKEDNRQLTNAFEIAEGIIKRMGKAAEAAAKEGKPSV